MKTYKQFIFDLQEAIPNPVSDFGKGIRTAAQVYRYMTGIDKIPYRGQYPLKAPSLPKPPTPAPAASSVSSLAPTALRAGTIAAVSALQGDTPQSGPAYVAQQKARAQATANYAAKTGQFGKYVEPTSRFANARDTAFDNAKKIKGSSVVGPKNVGAAPAPKPLKPKFTDSKPASKVTTPEDPDIKKYNQLRKSDPAKAKELGMKIWSAKYRPALSSPEVA